MSTDNPNDPLDSLICRFMRRFIYDMRKKVKRIRNRYQKKEQYTGTRKGFKRMMKARGQAEGENK